MIRDWQGKFWEERENIYYWIKIKDNRWTNYTSWLQFVDNKWYTKGEMIIPELAKTFWWRLAHQYERY